MKSLERSVIVLALAACLLPFAAVAADMPRSEWQAKIGESARDASVLADTMKKLSDADQVAFVSAVNAAIAKMPGSEEARAAASTEANLAAIASASKANKNAVLAEVFATVPPEYLTEINERLSKGLNRKSMGDAQFVEIAKKTIAAVAGRCRKAESADVRTTFAILSFLRASEGSPADLRSTLVALLPGESARAKAIDEWIRPALGEGQEQTYDPMLGMAQAGEEPDHAIVTQLVGGPQISDALLADLAAESSDVPVPASRLAGGAFSASIAGIAPNNDAPGIGLNRVPRAAVQNKDDENPYYTHGRGDKPGTDGEGGGGGGGGFHPSPYGGQGY